MVLTGYVVLSSVSMTFLVTVVRRSSPTALDASPGASGPHAFAVRRRHRSSKPMQLASIAPRRTFRDDAHRPSSRRDAHLKHIFPENGSKIFCRVNRKTRIDTEMAREISVLAQAILSCAGARRRGPGARIAQTDLPDGQISRSSVENEMICRRTNLDGVADP
jgi:hypothetical protein